MFSCHSSVIRNIACTGLSPTEQGTNDRSRMPFCVKWILTRADFAVAVFYHTDLWWLVYGIASLTLRKCTATSGCTFPDQWATGMGRSRGARHELAWHCGTDTEHLAACWRSSPTSKNYWRKKKQKTKKGFACQFLLTKVSKSWQKGKEKDQSSWLFWYWELMLETTIFNPQTWQGLLSFNMPWLARFTIDQASRWYAFKSPS